MPPRSSVDRMMRAHDSFSDPKLKFFHDRVLPSGRGEPRYPPVVYKAISDAIQQVQAAGGSASAQADKANAAIQAFMQTYKGATLL
jgi:multiple sugar transport system substrate-binding protein